MLIAIDASRANDDKKTGVGWYAWHIIEHFKHLSTIALEHNRQPVRVVLYSREPLRGDLAVLPHGWESKVLKWLPGRLWTQFRLSWEMLFHAPDVLFIPAHVFPIIHPKKTVMTVHDIAAIKFPESYNWFERWYTLFSSRKAVSSLWKIIVPSQFTKDELLKDTRIQGYKDTKNIEIVYHGYNKKYSENNKDVNEILKKYSIIKPYLLSVGRLEEKKNTVRIIKAFEDLRLKAYDLQLMLVGSPGFGYEKVKKAIEESEFKNDIITPCWVDNGDLPALMQGAKVFVFPSLYEGFGIPVLEAFASGTPVVASGNTSTSLSMASLGASQEIGGDACEYVDPMSVDGIVRGIEKILKNVEYRVLIVDRGKERVRGFSWEKCARETWDILNS